MVNIDDFIRRLEIILEYYNLSASSFADKIGVQRSSLSHLLSGRNKPSLDLILKIVSEFPDVDLYWILNGKGDFPKSDSFEGSNYNQPISPLSSNQVKPNEIIKENLQADLFSGEQPSFQKNRVNEIPEEIFSNTRILSPSPVNDIEVERIVFFYKDGTFKEYKNQKP
ncbi:helix-turn-helix domain-containing protein [Flavobacterium amniphilum]|uniref:helix-turn-helix transcriptional regulator n=1 Tax=Flavobacterium amniphilum TaxID=1834035 RepID=UPI002029C2A3|nr:helix-turn-helix transcriptional regulator [Flavobacterium amniphilum]MCL9804266.1 helix-turn-helix domain-containing protein [Flavobacterium amniphilum]